MSITMNHTTAKIQEHLWPLGDANGDVHRRVPVSELVTVTGSSRSEVITSLLDLKSRGLIYYRQFRNDAISGLRILHEDQKPTGRTAVTHATSTHPIGPDVLNPRSYSTTAKGGPVTTRKQYRKGGRGGSPILKWLADHDGMGDLSLDDVEQMGYRNPRQRIYLLRSRGRITVQPLGERRFRLRLVGPVEPEPGTVPLPDGSVIHTEGVDFAPESIATAELSSTPGIVVNVNITIDTTGWDGPQLAELFTMIREQFGG